MAASPITEPSGWIDLAYQFPIIAVLLVVLWLLRRWENQRLDEKEKEHFERSSQIMTQWRDFTDNQRRLTEEAQTAQAKLHVHAFETTTERLSESFELVAKQLGHLDESHREMKHSNEALAREVRRGMDRPAGGDR